MVVPIFSVQLFTRFQLLHRFAQFLLFSNAGPVLDELDYPVSHEFAIVAGVVEDGMAEVLEVDSDLMGSACDWVALEQRTVCFGVVP